MDGSGLAGCFPGDPDRPLAALRRIVDALDQVPGDAAAVGGGTDPGPTSSRRCAGGDSRPTRPRCRGARPRSAGRRRAPCAARSSRAACGSRRSRRRRFPRRSGRSSRPTRPGRGTGGEPSFPSNRSGFGCPSRTCRDPRVEAAAPLGPDLAPLRGQQLVGVLDDLAALPVEHRPERLPERADVDVRRAEHHPLAEGADVTPALAPGPGEAQRHRPRWNRVDRDGRPRPRAMEGAPEMLNGSWSRPQRIGRCWTVRGGPILQEIFSFPSGYSRSRLDRRPVIV